MEVVVKAEKIKDTPKKYSIKDNKY